MKKEKIKVEYAHITARYDKSAFRNHNCNILFDIQYKPIDEDDVHIGFSSYALDLVLHWLNTEFEIVNTTLSSSYRIKRRNPKNYKKTKEKKPC